jgi:hypothetical protein
VLLNQLESTEGQLSRLGTVHERAYAEEEKTILSGLLTEGADQKATRAFEDAHVRLGTLLGFDAGKREGDATPDPWWIAGADYCIIFEDHSGAKPESSLDATKARQAATHPNWVRKNLPAVTSTTKVISFLVSPVTTATEGAIPHLPNFSYWTWATNALKTLRILRTTYVEPGDLNWRETAIAEYIAHNMAADKLFAMCEDRTASKLLKPERPA